LVDSNGKELARINGQYINQQGYLKIAAVNSSNTVAIDQLDSKHLGTPDSSGTFSNSTGYGFSQYFGLNDFFKTNSYASESSNVTNSALSFQIQDRLLNNPSLISTGKISKGNQPSDASKPPNLTYQMLSGDNSVIQKLSALATNAIGFSATKGLSSSNTTFAQYAGQIIATTSTNAKTARSAANDSNTLVEGYTASSQKISGVNLDQELANTVIYQNSYSASARIVSVVSEMFDTLMQSV
jgi:flagellar hook-associated protein 1 FlgK